MNAKNVTMTDKELKLLKLLAKRKHRKNGDDDDSNSLSQISIDETELQTQLT